jgi:virginiamycin B lyase
MSRSPRSNRRVEWPRIIQGRIRRLRVVRMLRAIGRSRHAQALGRHGVFAGLLLLLVGVSWSALGAAAQRLGPQPGLAVVCSMPTGPDGRAPNSATAPTVPTSVAAPTVTVTATVEMRAARVCAYPIATDARSSLMYPAVDARGNVWFGKMGANTLARLDPRTGVLREWAVPGGRGGIMDTIVDAQGAVWFTESAANFLGRFDPSDERFTRIPLARSNGQAAEPQRLWSDASHGAIWCAAHQGMQLGRLIPATGEVDMWDVPRLTILDSVARPFSVAVAGDGMVWFGAAERGGALGRLDPARGAVKLYPLPACSGWAQDVIALAPDPTTGRVWFIDHQYACMGYVETATGRVVAWQMPPAPDGGAARVVNALVRDPETGALWLTSTGANALIRYLPETQIYTYYPLTTPKSIPYGLTLDEAGEREEVQPRQDGRQALVVAGEAAEAAQPGEAALDHPAAGQAREAALGRGQLDDRRVDAVGGGIWAWLDAHPAAGAARRYSLDRPRPAPPSPWAALATPDRTCLQPSTISPVWTRRVALGGADAARARMRATCGRPYGRAVAADPGTSQPTEALVPTGASASVWPVRSVRLT